MPIIILSKKKKENVDKVFYKIKVILQIFIIYIKIVVKSSLSILSFNNLKLYLY